MKRVVCTVKLGKASSVSSHGTVIKTLSAACLVLALTSFQWLSSSETKQGLVEESEFKCVVQGRIVNLLMASDGSGIMCSYLTSHTY